DRLLALADVAPSGARPSLTVTPADRTLVGAFLSAHAIQPPFVALAPGSIWGTKRWPYYAELAQRLAARTAIVVVGGPEDAALASDITEAVGRGGGRAVSGCASLTLRQSAEVIHCAAVLVTNDSAPLHFAQAVGTPTVAVFGSTVPAFGFGPRGPRDRVVELQGLPCRPCSAHGPATSPRGRPWRKPAVRRSPAWGSARPARSIRRPASCCSRRTWVGPTSRCATGWGRRWDCPPRSITTPTAPSSASGGAVPPAARTMWSG